MISIHAPAKGVTVINVPFTFVDHISIHTPAKGVTTTNEWLDKTPINFNPHSREGSDNNSMDNALYLFLFQSTLPRRE